VGAQRQSNGEHRDAGCRRANHLQSGRYILRNVKSNQHRMLLRPFPVTPAYAISKAAAFNMTQSFRALLAAQGVRVHAVLTGPTDTDMTRGFEIPKASPESVAQGIFDGVEKGEEDIFPDPASQSIAEGWRTGVVKAMEHQFAAFAPQAAAA